MANQERCRSGSGRNGERRTLPLAAAALVAMACGEVDPGVLPISGAPGAFDLELQALGDVIGDSRIVLLGENGHGVGELGSYLLMRGSENPEVRVWADAERPYLRMGIDAQALIPAAEFDALLFVNQATVPQYQIR